MSLQRTNEKRVFDPVLDLWALKASQTLAYGNLGADRCRCMNPIAVYCRILDSNVEATDATLRYSAANYVSIKVHIRPDERKVQDTLWKKAQEPFRVGLPTAGQASTWL